jgi:hypothetical protein
VKDVGAALAAGVFAPLRRPKLVLALWLARLLPVVLFFTLPLHSAAKQEIGKNPQARLLLDAPKDSTGFAWAWTSEFVARFDPGERVFWVTLAAWFLVTGLSGGLVASFVLKPERPLVEACGRYACRFLRLGLLAAVLLHLADSAINGILLERHVAAGRAEFTQQFATSRALWRGSLFAALVVILGAVRSYAGIDIVAYDRRSAFLSFARGFGILFARLPKLLAIEVGMLLAAGGAAAAAGLVLRIALPGADATWASVGVFLAAAGLGSYVRTGIELGTLEARCRVLAPPGPPLSPLETVLGGSATPA